MKKKNMHILYFHQYFSTNNGSNGTRSYQFALSLLKKGFQVTIVCLNTDRSNSGLVGNSMNGYRRGYVNGIEVIEFDIEYSNNKSLIKRALIFLEFTIKLSLIHI